MGGSWGSGESPWDVHGPPMDPPFLAHGLVVIAHALPMCYSWVGRRLVVIAHGSPLGRPSGSSVSFP